MGQDSKGNIDNMSSKIIQKTPTSVLAVFATSILVAKDVVGFFSKALAEPKNKTD